MTGRGSSRRDWPRSFLLFAYGAPLYFRVPDEKQFRVIGAKKMAMKNDDM
jgi:hypothetical protein